MVCPSCGAPVAEGSAFCPSCGASISPPEPAAVVAESIAPPPLPASVPTPPPPPPPVEPPPFAAGTGPAVAAAAAPAPAASGAPYPKAPLGARFGAVLVDGIIASALIAPAILFLYAGLASGGPAALGWALVVIGGVWELVYLLGRDGFGGAGFGKRLARIVVVSQATGAPATMGASIVRQGVLWLLGLIPAIGSIVEPVMVIADKDGRRLGDRAAKTQVARADDVAARGHLVPAGRGAAVAALIVALLVSVAGGAAGGLAFAKALESAGGGDVSFDQPLTQDPDISSDLPVPDTGVSPEGAASQVVEDFYASVSAGDFEAAKTTLSAEFAAGSDPGMFEGWTAPDYQILGETAQDDGTMLVEVQEVDGGLANGLVSFVLVDEDGWKIDYWLLGGLDDQGQAESDAPLLNPESATDAVGQLLTALQNDQVETMKTLVTKDFLRDDPTFFRPTNGVLTSFEITDVFQDGGTYIVVTSESWPSGPEPMNYVVVEQDGKVLVNGWVE